MIRPTDSPLKASGQDLPSFKASASVNPVSLRSSKTENALRLTQRASSGSQPQQLGEISLQRATASNRGFTDGVIRLGQKLRGMLNRSENSDLYDLKGLKPGQQVEIQVNTKKFFSGLNLLNARTGEVVLRSYWRSNTDKSAHLYFTPERGVKYQLRVAGDEDKPKAVGAYEVKVKKLPSNPSFNFFSGSGLVDAAAAVARATGQAPFADVADLGGDSWNLDMIKAPEVWAQGFTGRGVTVAVIGSGVELSHPDLQGSLWTNTREVANNGIDDDGNGYVDDFNGWNFADRNSNVADVDSQGAGTHSAGLIAAANNGVGTTGIAPDAKIMAIRVAKAGDNLTPSVRHAQSDVAEGIRYAVDNGAKVIQLSHSYPAYEKASQIKPELEAALQYARQAGAVVVASAGNDRQYNSPDRPGELSYFAAVRDLGIAVGAIDRQRNVFINGNPAGLNRIDYVVAPGIDVQSTTVNSGYGTISGPGRATAHITGVVALMMGANPSLTPTQIEEILTATTNRQKITATP